MSVYTETRTYRPLFDVRLDPAVLTADPITGKPTRAELKINEGPIRIDQAGVDWGDAAIQAYMSDMLIGSRAVDFRIPNRNVHIPLFLGADESDSFDYAKNRLMQKVGRLQEEGGWVQRMKGLYADVVNATLTFPDVWGEAAGVEPNVVLQLECLPDLYGDEIHLDQVTTSDVPAGGVHAPTSDVIQVVLRQNGQTAQILGNHSARCRIVPQNGSNVQINGLIWGLRSRYSPPSPNGRAYLAYQASDLTPINGSVVYPSSSPTSVINAVLISGQWLGVLSTIVSIIGPTANMQHQGSYRVWAQVTSQSSPQIRFAWAVGSTATPVYNDAVTLPSPSGYNYLVDLGEIRLNPPPSGGGLAAYPTGVPGWAGVIQVYPDQANTRIQINNLYFQPLDEGAGRVMYNPIAPATNSNSVKPSTQALDNVGNGTIAWTNPAGVTKLGDNSVAQISFSALGQKSHWIQATVFGFNIPLAATIVGVGVQVWSRCDTAVGGLWDDTLTLYNAGGTSANRAKTLSSWPAGDPGGGGTTYSPTSYGGSADLWGLGAALTPTVVNASGFGVLFSARSNTTVGTPPFNGSVDYIAITVYYQQTTGLPSGAGDAVIFAQSSSSGLLSVVPQEGEAPAQQIQITNYYPAAELGTNGIIRTDSLGQVWGQCSRVVGDLPRLPVAGLEGRPIELFLKGSSGDLNQVADSGLVSITPVDVYYRPTYLFPP